MLIKILMLFTLVSHAISDSCVRYTFEEGFNDIFTNDLGVCSSFPFWSVGKYSDLNLLGQNERSTSFITPLPALSCVNSFIFPMNGGGNIEVNIYMDATDRFDQIIVIAQMADDIGATTRIAGNSVMDPHFVSGWHALKMTLAGSPTTHFGYISILGMASPNSTVLVDSFRYIPPGMDERECPFYEDFPKVNHPRFKNFNA